MLLIDRNFMGQHTLCFCDAKTPSKEFPPLDITTNRLKRPLNALKKAILSRAPEAENWSTKWIKENVTWVKIVVEQAMNETDTGPTRVIVEGEMVRVVGDDGMAKVCMACHADSVNKLTKREIKAAIIASERVPWPLGNEESVLAKVFAFLDEDGEIAFDSLPIGQVRKLAVEQTKGQMGAPLDTYLTHLVRQKKGVPA